MSRRGGIGGERAGDACALVPAAPAKSSSLSFTSRDAPSTSSSSRHDRRYLKRRAAEALAALESGGGSSSSTGAAAAPGPSSSSSLAPPSLLAGVGAATPEAAGLAFARAAEELRAFERQAVVYELYARKDLKNVLEVDADAAAAGAAGGGGK